MKRLLHTNFDQKCESKGDKFSYDLQNYLTNLYDLLDLLWLL